MNARDFCYWLQGWFEMNKGGLHMSVTVDQLKMIEEHLSYVFTRGDLSNQTKDVSESKLSVSPPPYQGGWSGGLADSQKLAAPAQASFPQYGSYC